MRRVLSELFHRPNPKDNYFNKNCSIDPRVAPTDLFQEFQSKKKLHKFISYLNQPEKNGLKMLNKLTVIHLCLIHAPHLCLPLSKVDFKQVSQDQWLTQYILKPYQTFLNKLCFSYELYNLIKSNRVIDFTFDNLFYSLQLLKGLLQCSKKISNLHHYYHKQAANNYPFVLRNFVMMLAHHSQQIYSIFKAILSEFIRFPQRYIVDAKAENIIKYILQDQLAKLNESMRQLFLNSSFFPYGKGFSVKLLHIEELPDQTREFAQSILYPNTQRIRKKKITMDSILFDRGGQLNPDILNGLQHISMGQEGIVRGQEILNTAISKRLKNYIENIEQV